MRITDAEMYTRSIAGDFDFDGRPGTGPTGHGRRRRLMEREHSTAT
ncbi:MAG: hypothetical protein WCC08_16695 [Terrimicrobiaceae bacterium]